MILKEVACQPPVKGLMLILRCLDVYEIQRVRKCTGARHIITFVCTKLPTGYVSNKSCRGTAFVTLRSGRFCPICQSERLPAQLGTENRRGAKTQTSRLDPSCNELQGTQKFSVCLEKKRKLKPRTKSGRLPIPASHAGSRYPTNVVLGLNMFASAQIRLARI